MRPALFSALLALLLSACDAPREPAGQARLFDSQRQVLEKAKGVDNTVQQADQQRRAEEDAQSR